MKKGSHCVNVGGHESMKRGSHCANVGGHDSMKKGSHCAKMAQKQCQKWTGKKKY